MILNNLLLIAQIIHTVAICIGAFLLLAGLYQFKKYGEMRTMMSSQMSMSHPVMMMVAAAMLFALPTIMKLGIYTIYGVDSPIGYMPAYSPVLEIFYLSMRVVGLGSLVRGIYLLSRTGQHGAQPGTTGKAIVHMIGGFLGIHIAGTMAIIASIFSV